MLSGPPQAVSVVQLDNSSTVRVSWEPPLADIQDEPILEYRVRALALYLHFFHHSVPFWKSLENFYVYAMYHLHNVEHGT